MHPVSPSLHRFAHAPSAGRTVQGAGAALDVRCCQASGRGPACRGSGEWPAGERRRWEPNSSVRRRAQAVLARYTRLAQVEVICHGVVIHCLTGEHTTLGGISPYVLDADPSISAAR